MRWAVPALHRLPGRLIQSCISPRASFPNDVDTPQKSIRGQRSAIVNIAQYQMSGTILRVTSVSATRKLGFSRTRRSIALSASAGRSAGGWRWPLPGSSRSSASDASQPALRQKLAEVPSEVMTLYGSKEQWKSRGVSLSHLKAREKAFYVAISPSTAPQTAVSGMRSISRPP